MKSDPTAFSDLDQLYTQILSVYPSSVNIAQVLGFIVVLRQNLPELVADILEMEAGDMKLVLQGLSSLMKDEIVVNPYFTTQFAHTSFRDYLLDSRRSGPFHVNLQEYQNQFTIRSFALIIQSIRFWR